MGRSKAWLPFGDELLLPRVVRILGMAVGPIVVVAAAKQDMPPLPTGVEVVHDAVHDKGPLGGLAAGLAALTGRAEVAYLSACDVPLLRPAFVRHVVDALTSERGRSQSWDAAIPHIGGYYHPLAAAYRLSVRDAVLSLLAANRLRTQLLLDGVSTRVLNAHEFAGVDPEFESLRNVNTPDDYAAVLRDYNAPCRSDPQAL